MPGFQIESLGKRIKQLVHFHRLARDHPETNEAVVAILLLGWAFVEQPAMRLRQSLHEQTCYKYHVDQHGMPLHPISRWQVCSLLLHRLRSAIWGRWLWDAHDAVSSHLVRLLTSHPQQRIHQESALCQMLATHLAGIA